MHLQDLEICRYHPGPYCADSWQVPLRAVGWLAHGHAFETGPTASGLVAKLEAMLEQTNAAYPHYRFRGCMHCGLCLALDCPSPGPIWSQENLLVPGAAAVYLAPGGIVHYVHEHAYRPPREFMDAVLRCPEIGSPAYLAALRSANGGAEPPLQSIEQSRGMLARFVHRRD